VDRQGPDIYSISNNRPHVVLLGAGASLAACPDGDINGFKLPLMDNFIDTVPSLTECLESYGIKYEGKNFENLYSELYEDNIYTEVREAIEGIIFKYFSRMSLPDEPTLYDHLVLSLRKGSVIATFNWDPFLFQALCRNGERVGKENLPMPYFLHGNTALGVCVEHKPMRLSNRYTLCPQCGKMLVGCKLLYPVKKKNYNADAYIHSAWNELKKYLKHSFMFTIFGYGAPSSDVEAVNLLQEGWGNKYKRNLEQIEIIDVLDEGVLSERWSAFIHTHHYSVSKSFYDSWIARHSRRSCDACWDAIMECDPREEHPIPKTASWKELDEWLKPLLKEEDKKKAN
jgi:hypothetical protein